MAGPSQFVIFQDPHLTGEGNVSAIVSEAALVPTRAVPDDANEGDLLPFVEGTPSTDMDLDFQIVRAGGLFANAQWIYKQSSVAATKWLGVSDKRRLVYGHDPFADDQAAAYGACIGFSSTSNRVLCFRVYATDTIHIRYRSADGPYTTWSTATLTATGCSTAAVAQLACLELPDGAMRLFVRTGALATGDIDIYGSTDGGLTWALIARDLYQTWTGIIGGTDIERLRVRRSGDWLRAVWVLTDGTVQTFVSGDRGASWEGLSNLGTACYDNGDVVDPWGAMDLVGADDEAGTFLLCLRETAETAITIHTAARDQDWAEDTSLTIYNSANIERVVAATGSTYMWVFVEEDQSGGANSGWRGAYFRRDHPTDSNYKRSMGPFPVFAGSKKYTSCYADMVFAGSQLVIFSGLTDPDDSGNIESKSVVVNTLGWTQRTVVSSDGYGTSPTELFDDCWMAIYGAPAATDTDGNADSPWTLTDSGGSVSWNADKFQIVTTTTAQHRRRKLDKGLTPTDKWAQASAFGWTVKMGSDGSVAADAVVVRVDSDSSTVGETTSWSLRLAANQAVLVDNATGSPLATLSIDLDGSYFEFIAAQEKVGSSYKMQLEYTSEGTETWATSGPHTLGLSSTATSQIIYFGHYSSTAAGETSLWRAFWVRGDSNLGLYGFVNPTSLNGAIADPYRNYTTNGLYVRWGGGGGFEGDEFTMSMAHGYGIGNAFLRSPQQEWRSSSGATQTVQMGADLDNTIEKITADGLAVFGVVDRYVRVDMNDTDSWGSPSFTDTVTMDVYTGLTISGTAGSMASINAPAELLDGELVGMSMRCVGGAADGKTWRISRQIGARLYFDDETTALSAQSLAAGQTVMIFADRGFKEFVARQTYSYARFTFPGDIETATDDHRLAAFRLGPKLDIDPPFEWEHGDSETPNTALERTISGAAFSFKQGPEYRTITGRYEDIDGVRLTFRNDLAQLSQYDNAPMALVLDDGEVEEVLLVSYQGATDFKDVAFRQVNGRWRAVGAIEITFREEV